MFELSRKLVPILLQTEGHLLVQKYWFCGMRKIENTVMNRDLSISVG